jgi:hypothetical protein
MVVRSLWAELGEVWLTGVLLGWVVDRGDWFWLVAGSVVVAVLMGFLWVEGGVCSGFSRAGFRRRTFIEEAGTMPQFQIEGEAEVFEDAEEIDIQGEIARYCFVTAEKSASDDKTVIIKPVAMKDLSEFEGVLFQIDINEEEDAVILREVQMAFWPWDDDEEFEEVDSPNDDT